jgi:hypothetical protein
MYSSEPASLRILAPTCRHFCARIGDEVTK